MRIKQAVMLVGGLGTRLRPFTNDKPKPMIEVIGKPFAEHLIELLKQNGIKEVIFLSGYKHEKFREYFGNGKRFGVKIKHLPSEISDHTGDRVRKAFPHLADRFLLMYGDNYWPLDLRSMEKRHEEKGADITMAIYTNWDGRGEYGDEHDVLLDENKYISYFGPRIKSGHGMDIGSFIVEKRALRDLKKTHRNFQGQFVPSLISKKRVAAFETSHPYQSITNPDLLKRTERFLIPKKVVFLDRDGVINNWRKDNYVKNWSEFTFIDGAKESLAKLTNAGYKIFIVTNQRAIALGLMTESELNKIHNQMTAELRKHGAKISGIYYCPHNTTDNCHCRKPKAGLLYKAAWDHDIDLTKAIMVGDKEKDVEAGKAAGCRTILVPSEAGITHALDELLNE